MVTRVQQVLLDARYKLGDTSAERWSDARLLRLYNLAMQDIAKQTKILKGNLTIILQEGVSTYELPENVYLIQRATFNNLPLALKTHNEMDDFTAQLAVGRSSRASYIQPDESNYIDAPRFTWDEDTGATPQALIYDMRNMDTIKVYPIPKGLSDEEYVFDGGGPVEFVGDDLMGVVVDVDDYTFNMPYGVLVSLYDPSIQAEYFNTPYGVVTDIGETDKAIRVWYVRLPNDIETVFDTPELPKLYDDAAMHYIVAHAFDDDVSTRSTEKSNKAFTLYENALNITAEVSRRDGVKSPTTPQQTYRGPFNA